MLFRSESSAAPAQNASNTNTHCVAACLWHHQAFHTASASAGGKPEKKIHVYIHIRITHCRNRELRLATVHVSHFFSEIGRASCRERVFRGGTWERGLPSQPRSRLTDPRSGRPVARGTIGKFLPGKSGHLLFATS